MEPSSPKYAAVRFARLFDVLVLLFFAAAFAALKPNPYWSWTFQILAPLVLSPVFSFILYLLFGVTLGHFLFGIRWRTATGAKPRRLYDWLFSLQPQVNLQLRGLIYLVGLVLLWLVTAGSIWKNDLSIRPFQTKEIAVFAPEKTDSRWIALPFFYATGAIPLRLSEKKENGSENTVEFGLPYERGPPNRFLGKITAYWRKFDSKLTFTGPLTLGAPGKQSELESCLKSWMGCRGTRIRLRTSLGNFFEGRKILKAEWFTVPNDSLSIEERPQGIYLASSADRGRIREAYLLVGPKMAVQGFLLDRPDREEGETASLTLSQMMGSMRLSQDLDAPRAFIDPKLAALRVSAKTPLPDLIAAEGHLLAKVSIEPKGADSFYHLAGLGITLFRIAKKDGHIELAASSKTIVKSAIQFVKDIDPESKRLPEMEQFGLEVL